ncbi:hypothetical protein ACJIZ3_011682 [Penstemon smallii]|uniref:Uncharacterized protein n=1 Tax=Penstemon smallii TaxID=265156 RepID=A0ABD3UK86_9LAMI
MSPSLEWGFCGVGVDQSHCQAIRVYENVIIDCHKSWIFMTILRMKNKLFLLRVKYNPLVYLLMRTNDSSKITPNHRQTKLFSIPRNTELIKYLKHCLRVDNTATVSAILLQFKHCGAYI